MRIEVGNNYFNKANYSTCILKWCAGYQEILITHPGYEKTFMFLKSQKQRYEYTSMQAKYIYNILGFKYIYNILGFKGANFYFNC